MSPFTITVTTRGAVNHRTREQAEEKLREVGRFVKGPILGARMVLIQEANPRIPMSARAEAEVDLQGQLVRARASAPAMDAAINDVTDRLQRHLRRYVERLISREREPAQPGNGEWAHRSWSPPPSETFVRPVEEREIIRRKSFAFGPMSVEEAANTLEDLDHEFFLFHDANLDADEVLYWRDDGLLALIAPRSVRLPDETGPFIEPNWFSGPIEPAVAVAEMNAVAHRFLFFENAATGRGNVIYRRYDGHYGLIEPA